MFDPYHKWLGIPQKHRPPTHYQLLGIEPEEKDPEVIEEAAIRQSAHLRTYQIGEHGDVCTRLLDEISQARTTLLNPTKRRAYDAELVKKAPKESQSIQRNRPREERRPAYVDFDDSQEAPPRRRRDADRRDGGARSGRKPAKARAKGRRRDGRSATDSNQFIWIGAGAGGLLVVIVLLAVLLGGSSDSDDNDPDKNGRVARNDDDKQAPPRNRRPNPNGPINPPPNPGNAVDPGPMDNDPMNPPPERNPIKPLVPPVNPPRNPVPLPNGANATEVAHLRTPRGLGDFVVLPNRQEVILAHDQIEAYSLTTKKRLRVFGNALPGDRPDQTHLHLTSNGAKLVSILKGSSIINVHEIATGKSLGEIVGHRRGTLDCALVPGGKQIATVSKQHLRVWDVMANRAVVEFYRSGYTALELSADGNVLLATRGGDMDIVDLKTKVRTNQPVIGGKVRSLSMGPLGSVALGLDPRAANGSNVLLLSPTLGIKQRIPVASNIYGLDFSPDEKHLVAGGDNGFLAVWNLETYRQVCRITGHTGTVMRARFSADGRHVHACDSQGSFKTWKLPSNAAP